MNIKRIAYDDACHLSKYIAKRHDGFRLDFTKIDIRADKFHFKNHVNKWCADNCNPHESPLLKDVNTEVMKQLFSWLARSSYCVKYMDSFSYWIC